MKEILVFGIAVWLALSVMELLALLGVDRMLTSLVLGYLIMR